MRNGRWFQKRGSLCILQWAYHAQLSYYATKNVYLVDSHLGFHDRNAFFSKTVIVTAKQNNSEHFIPSPALKTKQGIFNKRKRIRKALCLWELKCFDYFMDHKNTFFFLALHLCRMIVDKLQSAAASYRRPMHVTWDQLTIWKTISAPWGMRDQSKVCVCLPVFVPVVSGTSQWIPRAYPSSNWNATLMPSRQAS